jgi:2,4-dienoyl-CoA reductase-like NADH-dependent reductase (Old Yellow Enzyme family)
MDEDLHRSQHPIDPLSDKTNYPMALSKPIQLRSLTLKNRVFLSALTRNRAVPTTVPNDLMGLYYKQRSGAGLLVTEGTLISQQG